MVVLSIPWRSCEADRIRARYGDLLVDGRERPEAREHVEVATIDTLVRLAYRVQTTVAHVPEPRTRRDLFFVDDGGVRYRYRAAASDSGRRPVTV